MNENEANGVMTIIKDLNRDIAGAKKEVAQDIMNFLQRNLLARPDKPTATMKFTAWQRLSKN